MKPFNIDVVLIEPGGIATEFGDVLYDPMVERAKATPYQAMSDRLAKTMKEFFNKPGQLSSPSVISNIMSQFA